MLKEPEMDMLILECLEKRGRGDFGRGIPAVALGSGWKSEESVFFLNGSNFLNCQ